MYTNILIIIRSKKSRVESENIIIRNKLIESMYQ